MSPSQTIVIKPVWHQVLALPTQTLGAHGIPNTDKGQLSAVLYQLLAGRAMIGVWLRKEIFLWPAGQVLFCLFTFG